MKIGSPKNLEGKNLLVGVSVVDGKGNAIGSDITTLKNGANVTFTSSANGVLVIDAESVTSVENATSAVYATNDKNGKDIATTYQTVINDGNKLNGAYVSGAVESATSAASAGSLTDAITINGVALNGGTIKTLADLNIASKTHAHAIDDVTGLSSSISILKTHVADATIHVPTTSGTAGQVLTKTTTGAEWADATGGGSSGNREYVRHASSQEEYETICAFASSTASEGIVPFVALDDIFLNSNDIFDPGTETVSSTLKRGHLYLRIDATFTIPYESGGNGSSSRTVETSTYYIEKFWMVNTSTGSRYDNWGLRPWRDGRFLLEDNEVASSVGYGYGYGWKTRTNVDNILWWLRNGMWPTVENDNIEYHEGLLKDILEVDGTYLGSNPDDLEAGISGSALKRINGVWRKGDIGRNRSMELWESFDMETPYSLLFLYRTSSGSTSETPQSMRTDSITETRGTFSYTVPDVIVGKLQVTGDITPGLPRKAEEITYAATLEVHPGDCLSVSLSGDMVISARGGVDDVRQTASIDILTGSNTVTAGQDLAIVGALTADKLNHCEMRWWGKEATLHVLYVEDATSSGGGGTNNGTITVSSQTIAGTAGTQLSYNLADHVTVSNGQTPTFALASGQTLPEGLSLLSSGVISGTTSATGTSTVKVKVSASNCPDVEMTVTFNIAESIQQGTITVTTNPTIQGVVGTALSPYNLASCVDVSNGQTPSFRWNDVYSPLPPWLTLKTSGELSGTPTSIPSPAEGKVLVSANKCSNEPNINITWDIIKAGIITVDSQTISGTVGNSLSFNLRNSTTVTNEQTPTFAVKSGNTLPAGIDLSPEGVFTGTPTTTSSATVVVKITARGCPDKEVSITFDITEVQAGSDSFPAFFTVTESQGLNGQGCIGTYTRTGNTLALDGVNYPVYSFTNASGKVHYIHISKYFYDPPAEAVGTSWILDTRTSFTAESGIKVEKVYGTSKLKDGTYEPSSDIWKGDSGLVVVSWAMGNAGTPALTAKAFGHPTWPIARQFNAVLQKYTYTGTFTVGEETFPYYTGNGSTPWYLFGGKARANIGSSTPWFYVVYLSSKNPTTISSWTGYEFTWGTDNNTRLIMAGGAVESTGPAPTYSEVSSELSTTLLNSDKWWYVKDSDYPYTEQADTITWEEETSGGGDTASITAPASQNVEGTQGEELVTNLTTGVSASNGASVSYVVKQGSSALPDGLVLSTTGDVTGTPTSAGNTTTTVVLSAEGCADVEMSVSFIISEAAASDSFPKSFTVSSVSYQGQSITAPCGTYTRTGEAFPVVMDGVAYPVYSYTGSDGKTYYICVVAYMFGGDAPAWMLTGTKPTALSVTTSYAAGGYGGTTLKSGSYEPDDTRWTGSQGSVTVSWVMGGGSSGGGTGGNKQYVYTVTGLTGSNATANGDYYANGETHDGEPVYTNGTYFMFYVSGIPLWAIKTEVVNDPTIVNIYKMGSADNPVGSWDPRGTVVSAYSGS